MNIDFDKVTDVQVTNVDMSDYPDFCDAYIDDALVDGKPATEEQLNAINENHEFVYEKVIDSIY